MRTMVKIAVEGSKITVTELSPEDAQGAILQGELAQAQEWLRDANADCNPRDAEYAEKRIKELEGKIATVGQEKRPVGQPFSG